MYSDIENKDYAEKNQWIASALDGVSYLMLIGGIIASILFGIRDCERTYLGFDWDYFDFWGFIIMLIVAVALFISWKALAVIVRHCLKYLNS